MDEIPRIPREEIRAIYPKVAQIIADALDRKVEEVRLDSYLMDDLEAESIDFLDILFRLERAFRVKLPQGRIMEHARGNLSEAEFEHKGTLTPAAQKRLQAYLDEVPAERFRSPIKVADVPRLFTVETFCKLVLRHAAAQG